MTNQVFIEDLRLVPVPAWWQNPWVAAGALLLLALAAYGARRWWQSHRAAAPVASAVPAGPPAHREALRRLAALKAAHAHLTAYAVATECSEILRTYLAGRYALPVRYQTTREFLAAVRTGTLFTGAQSRDLEAWLQFFDALKFAQGTATPAETLAAVENAERFVLGTLPEAPFESSA